MNATPVTPKTPQTAFAKAAKPLVIAGLTVGPVPAIAVFRAGKGDNLRGNEDSREESTAVGRVTRINPGP